MHPAEGSSSRRLLVMATASRRRAALPRPAAPATIELADSEPGGEELPVPEPAAIKTLWLRAAVVLPGEDKPWIDCKIYVALIEPDVTGLYVYRTVPEDGWTPDFYAPMPAQQEPLRGAMARNGIQLATDRGPVIITPSGACSCSAPLKKWTPEFAQRMVRWSA